MEKRHTYHEAGHAVANVILGCPFDCVSMEKRKETRTHYENGEATEYLYIITDGVVWPDDYTEKRNEELFAGRLDLRAAITDMAGPQAEAMILGEIDEQAQEGARCDTNGISACCRIASAPPGASVENLPMCSMEHGIINAIAEQAGELLSKHWDAVVAVANALNSRKRLTRDEVAEIVSKNPPQPPAETEESASMETPE
jgi:hypothetical protein